MGAFADQVREGLEVFDVDGTKVGKILKVDKTLGYFETLGAFTGPRYIPFYAIERSPWSPRSTITRPASDPISPPAES